MDLRCDKCGQEFWLGLNDEKKITIGGRVDRKPQPEIYSHLPIA